MITATLLPGMLIREEGVFRRIPLCRHGRIVFPAHHFRTGLLADESEKKGALMCVCLSFINIVKISDSSSFLPH